MKAGATTRQPGSKRNTRHALRVARTPEHGGGALSVFVAATAPASEPCSGGRVLSRVGRQGRIP
tara:strand:- start:1084 stop:1275 length:192 start_codon:yes stop_codon:yes gene_type:complete